MPDYSKGIIYKITSKQTSDVYYGSTTTFNIRKSNHKYDYKSFLKGKGCNRKSFEILKYLDWNMEEIEKYPCKSKTELERREGYYHLNFPCINKKVAGRTKKEDDKIQNAKKLKPIICDLCETQTSKMHLSRHQKTDKCKDLIWKLTSKEFNNILLNN